MNNHEQGGQLLGTNAFGDIEYQYSRFLEWTMVNLHVLHRGKIYLITFSHKNY